MPNVANVEVGIVADDLTGALDSAAAFCAPGVSVTVELWNGQAAEPAEPHEPAAGAHVVSVAAATRDLPAEAGEPLLRQALASIRTRSPRRLLLKVDSQLRGHPARDVAVALAEAPDPRTLAVVAPAFPGHGRTTIGGIHRVDPTDSGIAVPALFEAAGLATAHLGLEVVRGGRLANAFERLQDAGVRVAVVDAETDADLAAIASADSETMPRLWVGSAGLAAGLAAALATSRPSAPAAASDRLGGSPEPRSAGAAPPRNPARILVVAGSASPQTARQVAELVSAGAAHVVVSGEGAGPAFDAGTTALRAALSAHAATVLSSGVTASGVDEHHGRWAECVARTVAAATVAGEVGIEPVPIDGLVFSGGETMAATCRALGIHSLEVLGETELGIPNAISRGSVRLPVVSKAGAFGDDHTLVRAASRLSDSIRNHDGGSPTGETTSKTSSNLISNTTSNTTGNSTGDTEGARR